MASVFTYPTSVELFDIEQDLMPRLTEDRPPFQFFPQRNQEGFFLKWEQKDNYVGLQQLRGLNQSPPRVKPVGVKQFLFMPGVYGEYVPIEEAELTMRRQMGTLGTPVSIEDLVRGAQEQLLIRRLDRIEYIIWTLLINGIFAISLPNGGVAHTDQFPIPTFTAAVPWATTATATPLSDIRNAALRGRGHSVSFGNDAVMYLNQRTLNNMLMNTNAADLYGRRTEGLGTFNNAESVGRLLVGDNLPRMQVYEAGYPDDTGKFNLFIPDNKIVIIGKRPAGQVVGEFRFVRNANNPDMGPGPYTKVVDNVDREVPRSISVHDGFNGGPIIEYPSAVLVLNV